MRPLSLLLAAALFSAPRAPAPPAPAPKYEIFALRYATVPDFPLRGLVAGAPRGQRVPLAMTFWLLRGNGKVILFDAGFYRDKFIAQWKPQDYVTPAQAVERLGIKPGDITDIVISHIHWDHADGVDLFPNAHVWLQKDEYDYYVGAGGAPLHPAIDSLDSAMLFALQAQGRVTKIDGDDREIFPGIRVYTGGKHTYASEYLSAPTRSGTVVLASDNVYLYQNLDQHRPIAQTLDSLSNLAAQTRMLTIASKPGLIVPGHDPLVFERFPTVAKDVVRID